MAHRRTMGAVLLDETLMKEQMSSPLRRRSVAATPLSSIRKDLIQNDDESEILARRRQPQVIESPQTADNSGRRVSLGLVPGLSSSEVTEHYTKCIKLCAENKINAKNVFSLSMIDYMAVLNKRDKNSNNMQAAGTTLDVSTKIYGVRVDCVHSDVLKMAGDSGKQSQSNKEPDDEYRHDTSEAGNSEAKKKRRQRSQQIFSSNQNLTAKVSLVTLRPKANNNDSQTTDLLLQAIFPVHTTSRHGLHLYEDVLLDSPLPPKAETGESHEVEVPAVEDYEGLHVCPMFADFHFLGWSEADAPQSPSPPDSPTNGDFRFDLDASIVEPCGNDMNGLNYFDSNEESPQNVERCGRMGKEPGEQIVDFFETVAGQKQQQTLEYSYLRKSTNNLHWAGPVHWKPRSVAKALTESKLVGACRQQGGRKKKELSLDYADDIIETIIDGMKSKIQKKLLLRTVRQAWQEDKLTLPEDVHYDNDNPTKFYYHSARRLHLQYETKADGEANVVVSDNEGDYNYNNLNDTQDYCSQNNVAEEADADNMDDNLANYDQDHDENQNPEGIMPTQDFIGDNLVAAPKSITQLQIQYSSRAKKIDMKQLKHGIWKCLTSEKNAAEGNGDEEVRIKGECNFSEVYKKLPNVLRKDNTEALSLALAFSSLLHLGNEKNLCIKSAFDMSDLQISQE